MTLVSLSRRRSVFFLACFAFSFPSREIYCPMKFGCVDDSFFLSWASPVPQFSGVHFVRHIVFLKGGGRQVLAD
ncbi:hypothetical protein F5X97DRAFT_293462 [Nemania serpens]|nr:hypothetical protein F5X97DRAFT_293462 [Nemania serpens]